MLTSFPRCSREELASDYESLFTDARRRRTPKTHAEASRATVETFRSNHHPMTLSFNAPTGLRELTGEFRWR